MAGIRDGCNRHTTSQRNRNRQLADSWIHACVENGTLAWLQSSWLSKSVVMNALLPACPFKSRGRRVKGRTMRGMLPVLLRLRRLYLRLNLRKLCRGSQTSLPVL